MISGLKPPKKRIFTPLMKDLEEEQRRKKEQQEKKKFKESKPSTQEEPKTEKVAVLPKQKSKSQKKIKKFNKQKSMNDLTNISSGGEEASSLPLREKGEIINRVKEKQALLRKYDDEQAQMIALGLNLWLRVVIKQRKTQAFYKIKGYKLLERLIVQQQRKKHLKRVLFQAFKRLRDTQSYQKKFNYLNLKKVGKNEKDLFHSANDSEECLEKTETIKLATKLEQSNQQLKQRSSLDQIQQKTKETTFPKMGDPHALEKHLAIPEKSEEKELYQKKNQEEEGKENKIQDGEPIQTEVEESNQNIQSEQKKLPRKKKITT